MELRTYDEVQRHLVSQAFADPKEGWLSDAEALHPQWNQIAQSIDLSTSSGTSGSIDVGQLTEIVTTLIEKSIAQERREIIQLLGGPYKGTEGLDSFTLGWIVAKLEERS